MKDSNLVIRSYTAGVFVASVPEHAHLDLGQGTALKGLALNIEIASAATGAPTFLCRIHATTASAAATTDVTIASRTGMTKGANYQVPFATHFRSIAVFFDQDSSTTTAFSIISAYIGLPEGRGWTRGKEFY
jgi:hypothetical protein